MSAVRLPKGVVTECDPTTGTHQYIWLPTATILAVRTEDEMEKWTRPARVVESVVWRAMRERGLKELGA